MYKGYFTLPVFRHLDQQLQEAISISSNKNGY
jgi:hypothetical protein